jgi:hypothetical protein
MSSQTGELAELMEKRKQLRLLMSQHAREYLEAFEKYDLEAGAALSSYKPSLNLLFQQLRSEGHKEKAIFYALEQMHKFDMEALFMREFNTPRNGCLQGPDGHLTRLVWIDRERYIEPLTGVPVMIEYYKLRTEDE